MAVERSRDLTLNSKVSETVNIKLLKFYAAISYQVNVVFIPHIFFCVTLRYEKKSKLHGTFVQWVHAKFAWVH